MKIGIRNYTMFLIGRPFINLIIVYYLIIIFCVIKAIIMFFFGFPKLIIDITIKEKLLIITRSSKNKY